MRMMRRVGRMLRDDLLQCSVFDDEVEPSWRGVMGILLHGILAPTCSGSRSGTIAGETTQCHHARRSQNLDRSVCRVQESPIHGIPPCS